MGRNETLSLYDEQGETKDFGLSQKDVASGKVGLDKSHEALAQNFEDNPFGYYENLGLKKIRNRLTGSCQDAPLLSLHEREIVISNKRAFLGGARKSVVKRSELSEEELKAKRQRASVGARLAKAKVFSGQIIEATCAVDACRSLYRYLKAEGSEELELVRQDDSLEKLVLRVRGYVDELITMARACAMFVGAHSEMTQTSLLKKFDEGPLRAQLELIELAGKNARAKGHLWADQLRDISDHYTFMDEETVKTLIDYSQQRRSDYVECFDLTGPFSQEEQTTVV